jgi:hypothetical protein
MALAPQDDQSKVVVRILVGTEDYSMSDINGLILEASMYDTEVILRVPRITFFDVVTSITRSWSPQLVRVEAIY